MSLILRDFPRARVIRRLAGTALATAAAALAGCASTDNLDSSVQTYSAMAGLPAQAGYRYERLPSQATDPAQPRLEAWADASLARVGLHRDDALPRYSIQVWNRLQRVSYPGAAIHRLNVPPSPIRHRLAHPVASGRP